MRCKKIWHDFADFIQIIRADHPKVVWVILLGSLTSAAQPFVHLFFYARILNKVLSRLYEECIPEVVSLLLFVLILNLIAKACSQSVNVLRDTCTDSVLLETTGKAYTMEYEEFEKTETMDAIRRVKAGENSTGGIASQIQSLYILAEKAITIVFSMIFVIMLFTKVRTGSGNFFISIWSTIFMIAVFSFVMLVGVKLSAKSYKEYYEVGKKNEHFNSMGFYALSIINNYQYGKDIRVFCMQKLLEDYYCDIRNRINGFFVKWGIREGGYTGIIIFLTQMAAGLVYIILGEKAIYGVINTGEVMLYAGAVLQLANSLRDEMIEYNNFHYRAKYLKTYFEFIHKPSAHYTGTLPVEKRSDKQYEFTLENVSFQYPGTQELSLNNVSLKLNIGEKYAIVGKNGAGKTTLIKLLCRLYEPTQGRILLNGIDIKYYDFIEYTRIFSVVFQDFKLLSLPLAENIAVGNKIDENKMWDILEQVGLKKRVEAMPDGLYTQLYNNNGAGIELSGGEAQKLAIARALYKDGPFVILDEPTAALDPLSEAEVYEKFNQLVRGKTAIYISHRMSSCRFCNDIIVLEKGMIAERGNHEELLKKNGIYTELYHTQAQYYIK